LTSPHSPSITPRNIQLAKALKGAATAKTPAKTKKDDAVKFFKSIKKTPNAPARAKNTLEIEKFLRQVAHENGIKINFDTCAGGVCKKQPASKKKPVDDDLYSDDSDLESCDEDD
jgi:hypothetical protein